LALQGKLLRVLQEGTYERVGDETERLVDVRLVAATNRDLEQEVAEGRFRADLFYRLNVVPIHLPPLRQRKEDLPELVMHLLASIAARFDRPVPGVNQADLSLLKAYDWPGNIRELINVLERSIIAGSKDRIAVEIPQSSQASLSHLSASSAASAMEASPDQDELPLLTEVEFIALEKANLQLALRLADGKVSGAGRAASLLGVKPSTLASRLAKYGLK
jgi:transcriptional regulator with GAF, ATPase, and Fis domain